MILILPHVRRILNLISKLFEYNVDLCYLSLYVGNILSNSKCYFKMPQIVFILESIQKYIKLRCNAFLVLTNHHRSLHHYHK